MPPIIIQAAALTFVVGMGVVDEVLYFLTVLLLILTLVLIVNLGLDIEESVSPVSSSLAAMALLR